LLLPHAVKALVFLEENFALAVEPLEPVAHDPLVSGVGGANKMGRVDSQASMQRLKMDAHPVGEELGIDALTLRRLLHFLPVLIDAGEKKDILLQAFFVAGKEIGQHLFVGMTQVGRAVDVIDRGGEKIRTGHALSLLAAAFLASGMLALEAVQKVGMGHGTGRIWANRSV